MLKDFEKQYKVSDGKTFEIHEVYESREKALVNGLKMTRQKNADDYVVEERERGFFLWIH